MYLVIFQHWVYSQESWHLYEPADVVGVDLMFDGPPGQFVPLVSGAAVDRQPELHVLVLALLQVSHHLLRSSDTNSQQRAPVPHTVTLQASAALAVLKAQAIVYAFSEHLNDVTKVFPLDVVVCFDEDLSQDGLADGVVFGIELIESVESVTVLEKKFKLVLHL